MKNEDLTPLLVLALVAACGAARGAMATRRWRAKADEDRMIHLDLSGLPKGARIYRADLRLLRRAPVTGKDNEALTGFKVVPISDDSSRRPVALELRAPWYDRFDATEAIRAWGRGGAGFLVEAGPPWKTDAACLDVAFEGLPDRVPPKVEAVRAIHRAGQTFITFQEIDDRSAEAAPAWSALKERLDKMDADREVRYRVVRHTEPVTTANLPAAEWLADVPPMSGYNTRGRSVDQLIALHRRRAVDDIELAKRLARTDYFSRYSPDMAEMGELPVGRLAVEPGKPLAPRLGLYVHQPPKAGRAFYAVVAVVDGVENTRDIASAGPVDETVGAGEPVLQGTADVTVFFDYPGERRHYVQWAAPPLAHLPNQYHNWGVFVPRGYAQAEPRRLSLFFHDYRQRYLKPPWPHRRDTVLLSPHDAPYRSFGYGYHEALGTLRSFRQGRVRPFFAHRVDAVLGWAVKEFGAEAGRISCGGAGTWGGTAALQYGLRRPRRIAYVMADNTPDPNPRLTPYEFSYYGRGDVRKTARPNLDAVWGREEWKIPAASGKPVWEEMDLPAHVLAVGHKAALPFLSLGAGSMHLTWRQESDLMKAYLKTGNAFMAEFFWGSSHHKALPVTADQGDHPFEPRSDRPLLACNPRQRHPNEKFFDAQFATGKRGYGGGSRLNTRPRWDSEDVVDTLERLEMTIYCARRVVYAGRVTCDVVVRNTAKFRPKPGERLAWTAPDPRDKRKQTRGEATVDEHGHIRIEGLQFGEPGRLIVQRAEQKEGQK